MAKLAPSILSADFMRLGEEIAAAERAGADLLHIDIMDGSFVPNISIGYFVVEQIKKAAVIPLDVHLMITEPAKYLPDFIKAGADYLTVHVESDRHLHRSIQLIREANVKAAVALNPATPLNTLDSILPDLDMVVVMSVNPGFGGQKFIPGAIEKIKALKSIIDTAGSKAVIEVDGGVNTKNCGELYRAGAEIFVMGSAFYNSPSYTDTARAFRENAVR